MKKFSKINPKNELEDESKEKVLYSDDVIKVIEYDNWSIIKEKDLVVCIPYLIEKNEFILRYEYIPTYFLTDGQEYHVTVVGGQVETGETIETAILRELEEEAGIVVNKGYKLDNLKPLYISKGLTSKYHPFIIPLNEREYSEITATGDGSEVEKKSKSVRVSAKFIDSVKTSDLITDYLLLKLKEYMNLIEK
jgi:8-oxo-dGTP pyrophosphatase MutT (NUDIX family)